MGVSCFTVGIVTIIYYLSEGPTAGWAVAKTLAPLLVGLVLLVVFVFIEYKIDYPIMPLHIWRSRRLVGACATALIMMAALNAHFYYVSLAVQEVLGYGSLHASVAFIPHGVFSMASIGVLSVAISRVRTKIITIVGWLFIIASGVIWAQLKADNSYWSVPFPALIVNAIGMVSIWLCCQINSVADAADEDQGVVGAIFNTSIQVGAPIGIAIANIVANNKNSPFAVGAQLLPGYRDAFYTYAIIAAVGLVVTIIVNPNTDHLKSTNSDVEKTGDIEGNVHDPDNASTIKKHVEQYELTDPSDSAPATVFEGGSSDTSSR
ncbi:hypothetical protein EMPS_07004 [Entomortierella parvispora]|uniref:Major facilitator superfamily (MFS) profile domain-containing protein n=1 Tax=Entomortierella parvispora TaxID=205924 RepID=A0A9P3HD95_9FUNG|nr:hypothetical protein EMPS_07004 [Entomortierella parvispora]